MSLSGIATPALIDSAGKLHQFLDRLLLHNVRPVFAHALTLEWDTPGDKRCRWPMSRRKG